jgi:hypothetical protein
LKTYSVKKSREKTLYLSQLTAHSPPACETPCAADNRCLSLYSPPALGPQPVWTNGASPWPSDADWTVVRPDRAEQNGADPPVPNPSSFRPQPLSLYLARGGCREDGTDRCPAGGSPLSSLASSLGSSLTPATRAGSRSVSRGGRRPVACVDPTPATHHNSGRRRDFGPEGVLSLSAVAEASPSTALVLLLRCP